MFSYENFGDCPVWYIQQALRQLELERLEALHLQALPIAMLGMQMAAANGVKNPTIDMFNPYGKQLRRLQLRETVPLWAARIAQRLIASQDLPGWAASMIRMGDIYDSL